MSDDRDSPGPKCSQAPLSPPAGQAWTLAGLGLAGPILTRILMVPLARYLAPMLNILSNSSFHTPNSHP